MKFRGAASKTLARPSFKEASIAQIYDAISDATFIGNIDLVQTDISNYDLRVEKYMQGCEMLSVSAFYKKFVNPIELVSFSSAAPGNLQPRNVGDATVKGIEVDLRKNLSFISPSLSNLKVGCNLTLVESEVAMDRTAGGELESRELAQREGETVGDTRLMQGQAPYIINAFLNYSGTDNGWESNVSYNVQGRSLAVAGIGLNPDIYTVPFHNLSLKVSKRFGEDNRLRVSASASNILQSEKNTVYESFGSANQIAQSFVPFSTYGLSFNYKF